MEQDEASALPLGVLSAARNVKFHLTSAATRDGIQSQWGFTLPSRETVTGLAAQKVGTVAGDLQVPLAFDSAGNLYQETPAGSTKTKLVKSLQVTPPAAASMQVAAAYKRGYLAFGDLRNSLGPPAVFSPLTGSLDPLSMRPVGTPWTAATSVQVGDTVTPSVVGGNSHLYVCTTKGVTGNAEPGWNVGVASTTNDGTAIWTEQTPAMASTVGAGNICVGQRYAVVLYVNRNGYISGMSDQFIISLNISTAGKQVRVTPIPLGPSPSTVARIVAFTPAGQLNQVAGTGISSAGPYFWIPPKFLNGIFDLTTIAAGVTVADVVSGVIINSTLINDNVTTQATFNFTDDYLKSTLNDVSSYFRKIQVPHASDLYYSKNQKRMFYKVDALPSGWYVSEPDDPETVFGDTDHIEVAENNGENGITVRDFGTLTYAFKERSGHLINPAAANPSDWDLVEQWTGSGPAGPRAVDVGTSFLCYAGRQGVYVFTTGKPRWISRELPITWSNINWAYGHTIWVLIDDEAKEILIGVPYGKATVPSLVLRCNYEMLPNPETAEEFSSPIHFSPYIGKEIATGSCYKWSIDDIAANLAIRAQRTIQNPPAFMDAKTVQSQVLYASSNQDGVIAASVPGTLDDNGNGIDSYIETACPQIVNSQGQVVKSLFGPAKLGGVQANVAGQGKFSVEVIGLRGKHPKSGESATATNYARARAIGALVKLKDGTANIPYSCGGRLANERMRVRISNNRTPGAGFDVKFIALHARPDSTARPGS